MKTTSTACTKCREANGLRSRFTDGVNLQFMSKKSISALRVHSKRNSSSFELRLLISSSCLHMRKMHQPCLWAIPTPRAHKNGTCKETYTSTRPIYLELDVFLQCMRSIVNAVCQVCQACTECKSTSQLLRKYRYCQNQVFQEQWRARVMDMMEGHQLFAENCS